MPTRTDALIRIRKYPFRIIDIAVPIFSMSEFVKNSRAGTAMSVFVVS